jgi:hypothetical protein
MPRLRAVALLAVGMAVAACTDWGPGPDITGSTPSAVSVRYDAGKVTAAEADEVARDYCAGMDKAARLRGRFANDPSMTYADYACTVRDKDGK